MKIIPIAFDSLGTRSMATFVETKDGKVLIDPSVSLAPWRFWLPPHRIEKQREREHWKKIRRLAKRADILIVTHYHYDHHKPGKPQIYRGKIAFIKHPEENINRSQFGRAKYFLEQIKDLPDYLEYSDGKEFVFGSTKIKFSSAVPHGTTDKLGYVTQVCISDNQTKFIHTSDIQGALLDCQSDFIIREAPDICLIDGPMTYIFPMPMDGIVKILKRTKIQSFIIDHHYLRDIEWRDKLKEVYKIGKKRKTEILTAAEFLGEEPDLLEARRKELYEISQKVALWLAALDGLSILCYNW